jgi:hypothetical protein
MFFTDYINMQSLAMHRTGNKQNNDGVNLSKSLLKLTEDVELLLMQYFLSSFKQKEYYNLYHESDLNLNEVYASASAIFEQPDALLEQSHKLANHLYEKSTHPKIKTGEFYVAYFKDCMVENETVDAIGLFKSETKENFLKVSSRNGQYTVDSEEGINIGKLDKGCMIFNIEKEKGYLVSIADGVSKGTEALYWIDDFLHVTQRKDDFFHTQNVLTLCKDFVTDKMPTQYEVSKADQADLLNKSVKFFKEKENFSINEFANEVIEQPDLINSFLNYKTDYEKEKEVEINDNFAISNNAVKKQSRVFKSVIKLDKNFHIYVHGSRQYIQKGYDAETGMHFYQLFFKEESD